MFFLPRRTVAADRLDAGIALATVRRLVGMFARLCHGEAARRWAVEILHCPYAEG